MLDRRTAGRVSALVDGGAGPGRNRALEAPRLSRNLTEAGRLELKGAVARFKKKGTLEAADRNLADLSKVLVRVTPAPERKMFADMVFGDDVFRVWQEATLLNYKDFLERVSFNGQDNFRAFVRHVSVALPEAAFDLATREFSEKNAPAERFVDAVELAAYQEALLAGAALPARAARPPGEAEPAAPTIRDAMREFEVHAAQARAERPTGSPLAGALLAILGALMLLATATAFVRSRVVESHYSVNLKGLLAVGALAGIAMLILGLLYLRKAQTGAAPNPR